MGIYDRDYYREEQRGVAMRGPRTVVGALILVNVVLYLADGLLFSNNHELTGLLAATDQTLTKPWLWWQLLTCGFVHSASPFHVLFNMLQLWFLGREVEARYGPSEFLRLYLVMIVIGSLSWCGVAAVAAEQLGPDLEKGYALIGASGAVSGVVFLFVLNFPQRTLVLFPIPIPVKAWVIGVLLIVMNVFGQVGQRGQDDNTAYLVHLAGIAFAFLYFRFRWNLGRLSGPGFSLPWRRPRGGLRLHDPQRSEPRETDLGDEVDRILAKIHSQGESSLTRKERRTLENASRQYQEKRRQ
jgi:membrane associated rhomboid family serine protease